MDTSTHVQTCVNVGVSHPANTCASAPKEKRLIPIKEITFDLPYSGSSFLAYPHSFGSCPVKIRIDGRKRYVTITQRPGSGTTSVVGTIEHIATELYYGFFQGTHPRDLYFKIRMEEVESWEKPYEFEQPLYWDGNQFLYDRPKPYLFSWKRPFKSLLNLPLILKSRIDCDKVIETGSESDETEN
jgi:hypothetical protein